MTPLSNNDRRPVASAVGTLLFIAFGTVVWFAQFSVAYAVNTLACVVWQAPGWSDATIAAATLVALGVIAVYVLCTERTVVLFGLPLETAQREGLVKAGRIVALLATIAIVWTGLGVSFIAACAQSR